MKSSIIAAYIAAFCAGYAIAGHHSVTKADEVLEDCPNGYVDNETGECKPFTLRIKREAYGPWENHEVHGAYHLPGKASHGSWGGPGKTPHGHFRPSSPRKGTRHVEDRAGHSKPPSYGAAMHSGHKTPSYGGKPGHSKPHYPSKPEKSGKDDDDDCDEDDDQKGPKSPSKYHGKPGKTGKHLPPTYGGKPGKGGKKDSDNDDDVKIPKAGGKKDKGGKKDHKGNSSKGKKPASKKIAAGENINADADDDDNANDGADDN